MSDTAIVTAVVGVSDVYNAFVPKIGILTKPHLLVSLMAFVAFFGANAYAQSKHPTTGAVYNTKEASYIWYDCKLKNRTTLECGFTFSSVRKKAKPEDWEKDLAKAEQNYAGIRRDWEKGSNTLCAGLGEVVELFTGKSPLTKDAEKRLSEMPEGQKDDARKMLNAIKQLCRKFSKSVLIEMGRLQHDKDTRTCIVYSSFDRQTFSWEGENEWVSVQKDRGICHSVIIERFEREKKSAFDFWVFSRRKTVTNPSEKFIGTTCRELSDETEHKFDWRGRDLFLSCDYIEFGL